MLDFLRLRNFRSHRDTRLDFVPGVNVITAKAESTLRNNIGKTNIFRGLELVTKNRPLGGRFFSKFAGDKGTTQVDLGVDGSVISLTKDVVVKDGKKTAKKSCYSIDGDECRDDYGALKGGVPDRIGDLLNLSDLNVQNQLDEPFLVCSSPGEVARVFNRVTRLERVDEWVSALTTRINTANQETEILKGQLKKKRADLEQYADLLDIEREVQAAERVQHRMDACAENCLKVGGLVDDLARVEDAMGDWDAVMGIEDGVRESLELLEAIGRKGSRIESVSSQVGRLESIEPRIERCGRTGEAGPLVEDARGLCDGVAERSRKIKAIERIVEDFESLVSRIATCEQKEKELVSDYTAALRELGRCPTCFARIDGETLDRIVEEMA